MVRFVTYNGLLFDAIERNVDGTRDLRRRRVQILADLKETSYGVIKDMVEDRHHFKMKFCTKDFWPPVGHNYQKKENTLLTLNAANAIHSYFEYYVLTIIVEFLFAKTY